MAWAAEAPAEARIEAQSECDFERFLTQARLLRDYLTRSDARSNTKLVAAILPFDAETGATPGGAERKALFDAFQLAYEEARVKIDAFTLSEVLAGRSPFRDKSWGRWLTDMLVLIVGIVLMIVALTYSFWAGKVNVVLDEIDQFLSYDQRGQILRLIEMEGFFETAVGDVSIEIAEPLLIYNEVRDDLRAHFQSEAELPSNLNRLINFANPVEILWTANIDRYCRKAANSESFICPSRYSNKKTAPSGQTSSEAEDDDDPVGTDAGSAKTAAFGTDDRPDDADATSDTGQERILRALFRSSADEYTAAAKFAGRSASLRVDSFLTRLTLEKNAEQLRRKFNKVQNLWLPIVFGALGAIVYCMWRILTPHAAPLGLPDTMMRVAFAALAGLTLSMLFLPANVLSLDASSNRPLVYLTAFVFGYSVEAFVATLNGMNNSLSKALAPKS